MKREREREREGNHYSVNHSVSKRRRLNTDSAKLMDHQFKYEDHPTKSNTRVISLIDSLSPSSTSSSSSSSSNSTQSVSSDVCYSHDSKGYLVFVEGLLILNKYKLVKQLGKGTFSRVFECYQVRSKKRKKRTRYAIKIVRNVLKYQLAAKTELEVLRAIRDNDPHDRSCCIHIIEYLCWREHPIFLFPLYGQSMYSFMVRNDYKPFCYHDIIDLMHQICRGVAYIHSLNIIITDLKPENIVLMNDDNDNASYNGMYSSPKSTRIKLIDFGSAVLHENNATHNHLIQTRHYRSPEVIFKLNWSFSTDIWSIGCILVELMYGRMLFNTHCSIDHLNQMVKCIDAPPSSLLQQIEDHIWNELFDSRGEHGILRLNMYKAKRSPVQCKRLQEYFKERTANPHCAQLYDLCTKLLCWSPHQRYTAKKALCHPLFAHYNN